MPTYPPQLLIREEDQDQVFQWSLRQTLKVMVNNFLSKLRIAKVASRGRKISCLVSAHFSPFSAVFSRFLLQKEFGVTLTNLAAPMGSTILKKKSNSV
jgi:hypothetical protein